MQQIALSLFLVAAVMTGSTIAQSKGTVENCGDSSHDFQGWWMPNPVVLDQNLTVGLAFTPAVSATTLNVNYNVKYTGIPITSGTKSWPCAQVPPILAPFCPLTQGKAVSGNGTMVFSITVPQGKYAITLNITNENNEPIICGIINTKIVHSFAKRNVPNSALEPLWPGSPILVYKQEQHKVAVDNAEKPNESPIPKIRRQMIPVARV